MKKDVVTCQDTADAKMQTGEAKELFGTTGREQTKQTLNAAHQNDKHLKLKMSVAQR